MPYADPAKQRAYQRNWARTNKDRVTAARRTWLGEARKLVDSAKDGGCRVCGEPNPLCLDLHHLRDKAFNVSDSSRWPSYSGLEAEIAKCVVVCSNCHRRVHDMMKYFAQRGSAGAARDAHYVEVTGSSPVPATSNRGVGNVDQG